MNIRSVSFVDFIEFEFPGSILERAIALGDVDNDGRGELVVGNISGDLAIFKKSNSSPWRQYRGLGMVSCIVIGDICASGLNVVFSLTSEGWSHLMCFDHDNANDGQKGYDESGCGDVISTYHQSFPPNGKIAMVADVDGDGLNELITASTDRVVRVFKWAQEDLPKGNTENTLDKKTKLVKQSSKGSLMKFLSKDHESVSKTNEIGVANSDASELRQNSSSSSANFHGKFVCLKRWKLPGQVDSLSMVEGKGGTSTTILVSQPGAGYIYLFCNKESLKDSFVKQAKKLMPKGSTITFTDCHSSTDFSRPQHPLARNDISGIPTHVMTWCSNLVQPSSFRNFIAMCTLNGMLAVIKDEKVCWSMNFPRNLFTIQKLDITGDGKEVAVFCSLDGETFLLDQSENMVNFKLGQDVNAFCAGMYSQGEKASKPCLVYVTFNNRIRLYWDVKMPVSDSQSFTDTVVCHLDDMNLDAKFRDFIESEDGSLDNEKIKQLTSWCLYGKQGGDE